MTEESSFRELIGKVRAGDEAAAAELVRRYEPSIRRVARIRLADSGLQRLLDSTDICQSVFASFFVRAALGQYELDKPEHLLNLLFTMTRRKLTDHLRGEGAARRDHRRVQSPSGESRFPAASGASPSREVEAKEMLHELRRRLTPEERRLADLRAEGREWAAIAAEQGGSPEALRKRLQRAVERVAQEIGLDGFTDD
jgi:RNA polymerase sigma factor (sigma-70 family)